MSATFTPRQKYYAHEHTRTTTCQHCGEEFTYRHKGAPDTPSRQYCGQLCRSRAMHANGRNRTVKTVEPTRMVDVPAAEPARPRARWKEKLRKRRLAEG